MEPPIPKTQDEHIALLVYQAEALSLLLIARGTRDMLRPSVGPQIRSMFEELIGELEEELVSMGVSRAMLLPTNEARPC